MTTSAGTTLNRLILVQDGVLLVGCGALAYATHPYLQQWIPMVKEPPDPVRYALLLLVMVPVWLSCIAAFGLHRLTDRPWTAWELLWGLVKAQLTAIVVLAVLLFLTQVPLNRILVVLFVASSMVLLYGERLVVNSRQKSLYRAGLSRHNLLLVGEPGEHVADFVRAVSEQQYAPVIIGRLGEATPDGASPDAGVEPPRLGNVDALEEILHEHSVDEVVFFPPFNGPAEQIEQLRICETLGVPALFSIRMERPSESAPEYVSRNHLPFIRFDIAPKNPAQLLVKHVLDKVAAATLLVVASPVLVLTTLVVWIFMGRPILFSQTRAGLNGRSFRMYKFRTMMRGAEQLKGEGALHNDLSGPVFKSFDDPRVTPLGRFLRRYSLDELPQLFHVLGGTMSLVGPRPLPIEEQRQIRGWRRRRLSMKPGISGLWQVSGRSDVDFEEWMKLDLQYVDQWCLKLDASIALRTVRVVLTGRGAR